MWWNEARKNSFSAFAFVSLLASTRKCVQKWGGESARRTKMSESGGASEQALADQKQRTKTVFDKRSLASLSFLDGRRKRSRLNEETCEKLACLFAFHSRPSLPKTSRAPTLMGVICAALKVLGPAWSLPNFSLDEPFLQITTLLFRVLREHKTLLNFAYIYSNPKVGYFLFPHIWWMWVAKNGWLLDLKSANGQSSPPPHPLTCLVICSTDAPVFAMYRACKEFHHHF